MITQTPILTSLVVIWLWAVPQEAAADGGCRPGDPRSYEDCCLATDAASKKYCSRDQLLTSSSRSTLDLWCKIREMYKESPRDREMHAWIVQTGNSSDPDSIKYLLTSKTVGDGRSVVTGCNGSAMAEIHTHPFTTVHNPRPSMGGAPSDAAVYKQCGKPIYVITQDEVWKLDGDKNSPSAERVALDWNKDLFWCRRP